MSWDEKTYLSRIGDSGKRIRHAAGSPTGPEIDSYAAGCDRMDPDGTVLVLGMTPELRELAARRFAKTLAIDHSEIAIGLFHDWLPEELREKETIIRGCWTSLEDHLDGPLAGVLGDGTVANLPDREAGRGFLSGIASVLAPDGVCVMRNVMIPEPFDPGRYRFGRLLDEFRHGRIDAAEFGFTARLFGFHETHYHPETESLDNAGLYADLDAMNASGNFSEEEWQAIARYRFGGKNFLQTRRDWITLLDEAGFGEPTGHSPSGKLWYEYYPVESFLPAGKR